MHVTILGRRWELRFVPNLKCDGDVQAPYVTNKTIRINASLCGEDQLRVILHELLHAANYKTWDEAFVDDLSHDLARVLWRLNYQRIDKDA